MESVPVASASGTRTDDAQIEFQRERIAGILQEYAAGAKVSDLCRRHGMSQATLYKLKSRYGVRGYGSLRDPPIGQDAEIVPITTDSPSFCNSL